MGLPQSEPVASARKQKTAPIGAAVFGGHIGERMAEDDGHGTGQRHDCIDKHGEPGSGHMHDT